MQTAQNFFDILAPRHPAPAPIPGMSIKPGNVGIRKVKPAYLNLPGCTLSRAQIQQVITLVTIDTVATRMIEEMDISRNADRVRQRVARQASDLLKVVAPSYGGKALDRLINLSSTMWSTQHDEGIDAVSMLYFVLAMVEDTLFAIRTAAEKRNRKLLNASAESPRLKKTGDAWPGACSPFANTWATSGNGPWTATSSRPNRWSRRPDA